MTDGTRWETQFAKKEEKHHPQGNERNTILGEMRETPFTGEWEGKIKKIRRDIKRNKVLKGNVEMWQCYDRWHSMGDNTILSEMRETPFTGKWDEKDKMHKYEHAMMLIETKL